MNIFGIFALVRFRQWCRYSPVDPRWVPKEQIVVQIDHGRTRSARDAFTANYASDADQA